jgi:hypothetical protein
MLDDARRRALRLRSSLSAVDAIMSPRKVMRAHAAHVRLVARVIGGAAARPRARCEDLEAAARDAQACGGGGEGDLLVAPVGAADPAVDAAVEGERGGSGRRRGG